HRHAAADLLHDEATQFSPLLQAEILHLARLTDREQRVDVLRQIPIDQLLEPGVIDRAVLGERRDHDGDDALDGLRHCAVSSRIDRLMSVELGRLPWLPRRVQAGPAANLARWMASCRLTPAIQAAARTPTKQSPAAAADLRPPGRSMAGVTSSDGREYGSGSISRSRRRRTGPD